MKAGSVKITDPDDYVAGIDGWKRRLVDDLRSAVMRTAPLDERIKWTHLVYFSNGPVLLIRSELERVLFGFWRGKRLGDIEPRLKPGGKYELATMVLREGDSVDQAVVEKLVCEAVRLNHEIGNPTTPSI